MSIIFNRVVDAIRRVLGGLLARIAGFFNNTDLPRMDTKKVDAVLAQFEGDYFLDYAVFTGTMREYISAALEAQFRKDPNDLHRRAYTLGLYREEYTAYEDLGAFVDGFLAFGKDPKAIPLGRMIRYSPGNVKLDCMLQERGITKGQQLYDRLRLRDWVPTDWHAYFPNIDLQQVLLRSCCYTVDDCAKSQKPEGIAAFNKIKHGPRCSNCEILRQSQT